MCSKKKFVCKLVLGGLTALVVKKFVERVWESDPESVCNLHDALVDFTHAAVEVVEDDLLLDLDLAHDLVDAVDEVFEITHYELDEDSDRVDDELDDLFDEGDEDLEDEVVE